MQGQRRNTSSSMKPNRSCIGFPRQLHLVLFVLTKSQSGQSYTTFTSPRHARTSFDITVMTYPTFVLIFKNQQSIPNYSDIFSNNYAFSILKLKLIFLIATIGYEAPMIRRGPSRSTLNILPRLVPRAHVVLCLFLPTLSPGLWDPLFRFRP